MGNKVNFEFFKNMFIDNSLKYQDGGFSLVETKKNFFLLLEQVKLIYAVSFFKDCLESKFVFCFAREDLKEVGLVIKKNLFKKYASNVIITNFENIFREDLVRVKLVVFFGKTTRELQEGCVQRKILFLNIISPDFDQGDAYQLPVKVDNTAKLCWYMLFVKNIFLLHSERIKEKKLKKLNTLKLEKEKSLKIKLEKKKVLKKVEDKTTLSDKNVKSLDSNLEKKKVRKKVEKKSDQKGLKNQKKNEIKKTTSSI